MPVADPEGLNYHSGGGAAAHYGAVSSAGGAYRHQQQPRPRPQLQQPPPQQQAFDPEAPLVAGGASLYNSVIDDAGPSADNALVQCRDCGRSFRPEAMQRHMKVCKKVFVEKRKQFNSAENRLGGLENAQQLISNAKAIEREVEVAKRKATTGAPSPQAATRGGYGGAAAAGGSVAAGGAAAGGGSQKSMPAWKKKSLEFRAAMLAAKAAQGDEGAAQQVAAVQDELAGADGDKTTCPHCGRSFADQGNAQKHIDICLKMFGGKAQRLVRGGGKNCNPRQAPAQAEPAADRAGHAGGAAGSGPRRGPPTTAAAAAPGYAAGHAVQGRYDQAQLHRPAGPGGAPLSARPAKGNMQERSASHGGLPPRGRDATGAGGAGAARDGRTRYL